MSQPFAKVMCVLKNFHQYSESVVNLCSDYLNTSVSAGKDIGKTIGSVTTAVGGVVYGKHKKGGLVLAVCGSFGEVIGGGVGYLHGSIHRKKEYAKCKEKVINEANNFKEAFLPIITELMGHIERYKDISYKNIDFLCKSIQAGYDSLDVLREKYRYCVTSIYQSECRLELANRITHYFECYEEKLSSSKLEEFVQWQKDYMNLDESRKYLEINEKVFKDVYEKLSDENSRNLLSDVIVGVPVPIFSDNLLNKINEDVSKCLRDRHFKEMLSESYSDCFFSGVCDFVTNETKRNVVGQFWKFFVLFPCIITGISVVIFKLIFHLNEWYSFWYFWLGMSEVIGFLFYKIYVNCKYDNAFLKLYADASFRKRIKNIRKQYIKRECNVDLDEISKSVFILPEKVCIENSANHTKGSEKEEKDDSYDFLQAVANLTQNSTLS